LFKNISLWSLKYNYSKTFANLHNLYHIDNDTFSISYINKNNIYKFRNLKKDISNQKTIFFTIGRQAKINNENYLNIVKEILNLLPNSEFHFASDNQTHIISAFSRSKLINRIKYLGWVDIKKKLDYGDIYLDTPNLSGIIAAKCFAAGIPVVFFKNSNFWLNKFISKNNFIFDADLKQIKNIHDYFKKKNIEFNNSDYINFAVDLAKNKLNYESYRTLSIKISDSLLFKKEDNKYFFNSLLS